MFKYCSEYINSDSGEKGLWLNILEDSTDPDSLYPVKVGSDKPGIDCINNYSSSKSRYTWNSPNHKTF